MRETFPKGRRITAAWFSTKCRACGCSYIWHKKQGNWRCPHCKRIVPMSERALLPGEERDVMRLLTTGDG